ncbi:unnamed protein product, partial [Owenia fusiformis]
DVHYFTFDGLKYDFQGVCKYTLVEDITFQGFKFFKVFVKNRRWGLSGTSITQYVEVNIVGQTIRLDGPGFKRVQVDGIPVDQKSLPYNDPTGLGWYTVNVAGNLLTFESPPTGLKIDFIVHPSDTPTYSPGYGDVWVTLGRQWMLQAPPVGPKVDGLCKNYDNNTQNDCTDKAGNDLTGTPDKGVLLGKSYNVYDNEDRNCVSMIRDRSGPKIIEPPPAIVREASEFCRSIVSQNGFFKRIVSNRQRRATGEFEKWEADCKMDLSVNPDAKCDILEAFVVSFRDDSQGITGWREEFKCAIQCGKNEQYLYDGPGCEEHCLESEPRFCEEHARREGCFCRTGYVRCHGKCTVTDRVDCTWGAWSEDGMCTSCNEQCIKYCMKYRKKNPAQKRGKDCIGVTLMHVTRKCTGGKCAKNPERGKRQASEEQQQCRGWGDVHYITFDGLEYNFHGVCKYTLLEDTTILKSFKVFVKNRRWGLTGTSVTQYVEIYNGGTQETVRLDGLDGVGLKRIKVDGRPVDRIPFNGRDNWYTASIVGNRLTFDSDIFDISIAFTVSPRDNQPYSPGYGDVMVTLGRQWMLQADPVGIDKVDGLCKNYDGIRENDWKDKNGADLTNKPDKEKLLGTSYKVLDVQDRNCVDMITLKVNTPPQSIIHSATEFCRGIVNPNGIFKQIVRPRERGLKTWEANCRTDFTAEPNAKCDIAKAFADIHSDNGRENKEWRKELKCTIQCGQNEVYMHHGPGCEEHCEEDKPRWCDNKRREGCFCKPGYVRCNGNGTCIIP